MTKDVDIKVSVVIPARDSEVHLGKLLADLRDQSLREIEILIVYDGSSDGTYEVIRSAGGKDPRVRSFPGPASGPGAARNKGMDLARGKYLLFLDCDDRIVPDMISTMYAAAERDDADICLCASVEFRDGKRCRRIWDSIDPAHLPCGVRNYKDCPAFFFQSFNGWAWDKLFKRAFCEKWGVRFGDNYMLEDGRFVLPAMALAERITVLDRALIAHRKWGDSLEASSGNHDQHWRNVLDNTYGIAETLRGAGRYDTLERSFQNWLLNYSLWVLGRVEGEEQRKMCTELVRSFWPAFGLQDLKREEFYDPRDRYLYRRLAGTPEGRMKHGLWRKKTRIAERALQLAYRLKRHGLAAALEHAVWRGGKTLLGEGREGEML